MQYDEITYGECIKQNGFQGDNIKTDLIILSKYLYYIDDLKPKAHSDFIYEFCNKYITDFNEVKHYKTIDSCIKKGRKKESYPIKIDNIVIYNSYLKKIDEYDIPDDYKKVLLTILVNQLINTERMRQRKQLEKLELNTFYHSTAKKNRDVFNSSRIGNTYKIKDVIKDLTNHIQDDKHVITDIGRNNLILNFTEELKSNFVFYELKSCDFDKIGWVWDLYKGQNRVSTCEKCDKLVKQKSNRSKYCKKCAKEIKLQNDREIQRRRYNSRI